MHTSKRKPRSKKQEPFTPPVAVDLDALADQIYLEAHAKGAAHGLDVIVIVATQGGDWRAKWGPMQLERAAWFFFRVLAKVQKMLP